MNLCLLLLAVCAGGVTTQPTLTVFHTGIQLKDTPNIQQLVDGGEDAPMQHIGKGNGLIYSNLQ